MNDWTLVRATEFIDFNPSEGLPRNKIAKKVAMEWLQPFTRDILGFEVAPFNGGSKFRNGDTLMARITPCLENGKTAQVSILDDDEVGFGSTEFIVLRAKPGISDKDFIYYLSMSPLLRDKAIKSMVGSSGRQRVQQGVLDNTEFYVPPLPKQVEIGRTLRAFDDKIANNTKINHHLQQQAQALFDFNFEDADRAVPFTEVMQVLGGGTPKTGNPDYWNGPIPFFTPKDVGTPYALITEKTITEIGLANCNSRLYPANTIFVTARGTVGKVSLAGVQMAMNQSCYALAPNGILGNYSAYHITLSAIKSLKNKANGAVFDAIVTRDFESETVLIPDDKRVAAFETAVAPIYEAVLLNAKENLRLAELRDTLLPKLMSGEIDVSEVTI
ncbi:MAG: restriction endonuclease subunit S [Pelosinus sp.]|nr:restriction endonuclease subunit S [Pelosinus sp.]